MKTLLLLLLIALAATQMADAQLRVSADKTHLEDENGTPVLLIGSSAWDLFARVSYTDATVFIDSMASLGVNFVNARFMSPNQSHGPQNIYGVNPWQGSQTFASPINEPYWAHVDSIMDYLFLRHVYVWAFVDYLGHSDDEGFRVQTGNSTTAVMKAWGNFVAQRYGGYTNLIWAIGGDCDPTPWQTKLDSLISGIKAYSGDRLIANRDDDPTGDRHWLGTSYDNWRDFNYGYDQGDAYGTYHWAQYCRGRIPAMLSLWAEGAYENEAPRGYTTTPLNLRQDMWHWMTWNPCGYIFGNCPVWNFGQFSGFTACNGIDWKTQLNSPGHLALRYMGRLLRNRHWWLVKPDTSNVVLTAGYGNDGDLDYGTAGYCSDSSSIIVYLGNARTATVTSARLKGDSTRAYWYNPADGTASYIGMQTRASHAYTPPAFDRVLVLDAKVMNFPPPGVTVPATPPQPPVQTTPSNGATGVVTSPNLTWNASIGATSYRVQVSQDSSFGTVVVDQANIAAPSLVASGLTNNVVYYWHVNATNDGGTSSYSATWRFTTASTTTVQIAVADQWNLVSVPLTVNDPRASILFPTSTSAAFGFAPGPGYHIVDTLIHGTGYWLKFNGNQNVGLTGLVQIADTVNVNAGWNIIGSQSSTVDTSTIRSIPAGIRISPFYGYSSGYAPAAVISPGRGYWVKTSAAGQFFLSLMPVEGSLRGSRPGR